MENKGQIMIYQTSDGQTSVNVRLENDTVWLTQAQMAELFQKNRTVIGRHIQNVYKEGELERETKCAKFAHLGSDGVTVDGAHFRRQEPLSVGRILVL